MVRAPRSIGDYDKLFDLVRARREAISGQQRGDPSKAAAATLSHIAQRPPARVLLGSDAFELVRQSLLDRLEDMRNGRA